MTQSLCFHISRNDQRSILGGGRRRAFYGRLRRGRCSSSSLTVPVLSSQTPHILLGFWGAWVQKTQPKGEPIGHKPVAPQFPGIFKVETHVRLHLGASQGGPFPPAPLRVPGLTVAGRVAAVLGQQTPWSVPERGAGDCHPHCLLGGGGYPLQKAPHRSGGRGTAPPLSWGLLLSVPPADLQRTPSPRTQRAPVTVTCHLKI